MVPYQYLEQVVLVNVVSIYSSSLKLVQTQLWLSFFLGSSIYEVLPATFYSIGKKENDIAGVEKWLLLLRKHHLLHFVKNNSLQTNAPADASKNWYYLGPT